MTAFNPRHLVREVPAFTWQTYLTSRSVAVPAEFDWNPTRPGPGLPLTTPLGCPASPPASRVKCAGNTEAICSQ